jgi:hypothetical protein
MDEEQVEEQVEERSGPGGPIDTTIPVVQPVTLDYPPGSAVPADALGNPIPPPPSNQY